MLNISKHSFAIYAVSQTRRFADITIRYIWSNSFISTFDTIRYYRDPLDSVLSAIAI